MPTISCDKGIVVPFYFDGMKLPRVALFRPGEFAWHFEPDSPQTAQPAPIAGEKVSSSAELYAVFSAGERNGRKLAKYVPFSVLCSDPSLDWSAVEDSGHVTATWKYCQASDASFDPLSKLIEVTPTRDETVAGSRVADNEALFAALPESVRSAAVDIEQGVVDLSNFPDLPRFRSIAGVGVAVTETEKALLGLIGSEFGSADLAGFAFAVRSDWTLVAQPASLSAQRRQPAAAQRWQPASSEDDGRIVDASAAIAREYLKASATNAELKRRIQTLRDAKRELELQVENSRLRENNDALTSKTADLFETLTPPEDVIFDAQKVVQIALSTRALRDASDLEGFLGGCCDLARSLGTSRHEGRGVSDLAQLLQDVPAESMSEWNSVVLGAGPDTFQTVLPELVDGVYDDRHGLASCTGEYLVMTFGTFTDVEIQRVMEVLGSGADEDAVKKVFDALIAVPLDRERSMARRIWGTALMNKVYKVNSWEN